MSLYHKQFFYIRRNIIIFCSRGGVSSLLPTILYNNKICILLLLSIVYLSLDMIIELFIGQPYLCITFIVYSLSFSGAIIELIHIVYP